MHVRSIATYFNVSRRGARADLGRNTVMHKKIQLFAQENLSENGETAKPKPKQTSSQAECLGTESADANLLRPVPSPSLPESSEPVERPLRLRRINALSPSRKVHGSRIVFWNDFVQQDVDA